MDDATIKTVSKLMRSLLMVGLLASATAAHSAPQFIAGLLDGLPQTSGPQGNLARPSSALDQAPRISPAQAAAQAQSEHGGKVLSVNLERRGTQPQYRVKIIQNGNVRVVRVPAN